MKRNWYALTLLLLLGAGLWWASWYVRDASAKTQLELRQAYACTLAEDYDAARQAFYTAAANTQARSRILLLLVRRNLVDQLNQTMATLPSYANRDNQADLAVEISRAMAQLNQMQASFFGF